MVKTVQVRWTNVRGRFLAGDICLLCGLLEQVFSKGDLVGHSGVTIFELIL